MKILVLFVVYSLSCAYGQQYNGQRPPPPPPPVDSFSTKVDWDIFKKITHKSVSGHSNSIISPLSLKLAMAILYQASSTTTESQIRQVFSFESKNASLISYEKLLSRLSHKSQHSKFFELSIGSRMYLDSALNIEQKYREMLNYSFETEIKHHDVNNPKATVNDANSWVNMLTKGNLRNIVTEDDLADTVVLLLNTIYFKGTWVNQFSEDETREDKFTTNSTAFVEAPIMTQTNQFLYGESKNLNARLLQMPYQGGNFSMYFVLPDSINGLGELMEQVSYSSLSKAMSEMEPMNVRVTIPKFKFDITTHLVSALKELGVRDLFDNSASLPGIARGAAVPKKIYVSNILQKAGIDVNELGTTAYVATEVSLVNKFGEDDVEFSATRPFMFFIQDEVSKQILFSGKVENPTKNAPRPIDSNEDHYVPYNPNKPISASTLRPIYSGSFGARRKPYRKP